MTRQISKDNMFNKILLEGYLFFNQNFLEMHDYKLSDIKKAKIS